MKSLILIRHAKSSWEVPGLNDSERPLNSRGKKNAPFMGTILREKYNLQPDLIITSSASRARQTADFISHELNYPQDNIRIMQKLYSASTSELLTTINSITEKDQTVILIGHNPELTDLSNYLSGKYIDNIPTTGIVKLSCNLKWKEVVQKTCKLEFFIYPKLFTS